MAAQKLRDPGSTSDEIKFKINITCGMASLVPAITFTGEVQIQNIQMFLPIRRQMDMPEGGGSNIER